MRELTKYGYAESSDLHATLAGHIFSIKNDAKPIENGTLWTLGEVIDDMDAQEIYEATAATEEGEVILALSVLYPYDTTTTLGQHEMYLRKEAGEVARAYKLVPRDRYAVADYMITPDDEEEGIQAGNYVKVDTATGKYIEVKQKPENGFAARINSIVYKSNLTLVRLEVKQNG